MARNQTLRRARAIPYQTQAVRLRWSLERILAQLALVLLVLLVVIPFLYMLRVSLASTNDYLSGPRVWAAPINWIHYSQVWNGTNFNLFLFNSLVAAVVTTIIVVTIGSMAGFALAKVGAKFRENVMFFVLSTRMGPSVVFSLPLFLFYLNLSLIDTYVGLILVYTFYNLAFAIWLMHSFFREVPPDIEEASLLDGLSPLGSFRHISLPLVVPGLVATAIFVFIFTWNEFFYAFVLTRQTARTFPTMVPAFFGAYTVEWGQMFAASVMGVIPPLVFGLLVRRYLVRGLTLGQVK
jgi:multiple sugar transport system permease protein